MLSARHAPVAVAAVALVPLFAHLLLACARPAQAGDTPRTFADRFFRARATTLDATRIRSIEIRFVKTQRYPTFAQRLQYLVRRQGTRWADIREQALPENVVLELTTGERISNAGKAGERRMLYWQDMSTVYSANADFSLLSARWVAKSPGSPGEGRAAALLSEIGYYRSPLTLPADQRIELGPQENSFTVYATPERREVFTYHPTRLALGLPTTFEFYEKAGLMKRETFHHWSKYDGVWLPTRFVRERYFDPSPPPRVALRTFVPLRHDRVVAFDEWRILDVHVNRPLKPGDLAPAIPDGSPVHDQRFGGRINYRYKAGLSAADFEAAIKDAKAQAAARAKLLGEGGRP